MMFILLAKVIAFYMQITTIKVGILEFEKSVSNGVILEVYY